MAKKAATQITPVISLPPGPTARLAKGLHALAEFAGGVQITRAQHAEAEYAYRKLTDHLGHRWAETLPLDRVGKFLGMQQGQLNTFAALDIREVSRKPIDLIQLLREAFGVITKHRKAIEFSRDGGDLDKLNSTIDDLKAKVSKLEAELEKASRKSTPAVFNDDDGEPVLDVYTAAKVRRADALAAQAEIDVQMKLGELIKAADVEPLLSIVADRIRTSIETLGRQYGSDAQRIVLSAVNEAERRLKDLRAGTVEDD